MWGWVLAHILQRGRRSFLSGSNLEHSGGVRYHDRLRLGLCPTLPLVGTADGDFAAEVGQGTGLTKYSTLDLQKTH